MNTNDTQFVEAVTKFRTAFMKSEWNLIKEKPMPFCKPIFIGWAVGGEIDQIEWVTYSGQQNFWNLNSSNLNIFKLKGAKDNEDTMGDMPTHWMAVPNL